MMDFTGFARIYDQARPHPASLADQVIVDRAHGQQHGDRRQKRTDPTVAQIRIVFPDWTAATAESHRLSRARRSSPGPPAESNRQWIVWG